MNDDVLRMTDAVPAARRRAALASYPPRRPPRDAAASAAPRVSVVVPTYRRPDLLGRCLGALLHQRDIAAADFEILVVDDAGCAQTRAQVEAFARGDGPAVRYLRPAHGAGPAVARNAGWRAARAPLVAFTDDDTIPAPDWLAQGLAALAAEPRWSATAGRVVVPRSAGAPTDNELMTLGLESAEFVTANAFVRRAALARVGGFDERFRAPWREDSDLQFRLEDEAGPVGRAATAIVVHPTRAERWGASLRRQRNVVFDALLYKKHPQHYRRRIRATPPWDYYTIVAATVVAALAAVLQAATAAALSATLALLLVARFAWRRLAHTSRRARDVVEMLVTSALIPFVSVYWRLRGAWRWRAPFF